MDYCDSVWTCCNRTDIDLLERLQNRAGRITMKSSRIVLLPSFSMIIYFIIEKLFLGLRDKVRTVAAKRSFFYIGCAVFNNDFSRNNKLF